MDAKAKKHIDGLKESKAEKLQNGGFMEYANLVVSIFNSDHLNNMDGNNMS